MKFKESVDCMTRENEIRKWKQASDISSNMNCSREILLEYLFFQHRWDFPDGES